MSDALKTLLHPFERGLVDPPQGRALFLGAEAGFRLPAGWSAELTCVQPFKPTVSALERDGWKVTPTTPAGDVDAALVLLGRHRGRGERWLADALERVRPGGLIVVGGANEDGASSFARRVAEMVPVEDRASKNHGTVFWLRRPAAAGEVVAGLRALSADVRIDDRFVTAPGMFSHGHVDRGSALLADTLPALKGRVADFGAGWGYLAAEILRRSPVVERLDLFEADHDALQAAQRNVAGLGEAHLAFQWADIAAEPIARHYDSIVMNPPFHAGRAATPSLGETFIRRASDALKPRGTLWLVANTGLPYERLLASGFASFREVVRADGYKVIEARR